MKQRPQGFRRIYSGTSDTDVAAEKRMMTSGYDTFHRQKKREVTLLIVIITIGVIGALVWLWTSVIPNLDLF